MALSTARHCPAAPGPPVRVCFPLLKMFAGVRHCGNTTDQTFDVCSLMKEQPALRSRDDNVCQLLALQKRCGVYRGFCQVHHYKHLNNLSFLLTLAVDEVSCEPISPKRPVICSENMKSSPGIEETVESVRSLRGLGDWVRSSCRSRTSLEQAKNRGLTGSEQASIRSLIL